MSGFPEVDPGASGLHARWYQANREAGRVTAQRCDCGRWRAPARYRCPWCGGADWSFQPLSSSAEVESWTVTRRPLHFAFADVVPYAIVVGETIEGVRLLLQFRGEAATVAIGDRVTLDVDAYGVPFAVPGLA